MTRLIDAEFNPAARGSSPYLRFALEDKAVLGAAISFKTTAGIRITLRRSSVRAQTHACASHHELFLKRMRNGGSPRSSGATTTPLISDEPGASVMNVKTIADQVRETPAVPASSAGRLVED